jgi:hypothetical protein
MGILKEPKPARRRGRSREGENDVAMCEPHSRTHGVFPMKRI